jgi:hypothetical protein
LVFAGVVQSDAGQVFIPADRGVTLIGEAAYTVDSSGILVIVDAASVTGTGDIDDNGGTVIGPEVAPGVNVMLTTPTDGTVTFTSGNAALLGDYTIGGSADGAIDPANFSTNTLYVVGDLMVSAAITTAAKLQVFGDASVTVAQTAAVELTVKGDLTAD